MNKIGYIWTEEQFREGSNIVYRVRSLSYPHSIALIRITPHDYEIFKGEYSLKLSEELILYKLAKSLMDDYFRYSS